jgi:NADH dehydrogenase FAD-containing subunit
MQVVVLGAGFGGLELTASLSSELGDDVGASPVTQGGSQIVGPSPALAADKVEFGSSRIRRWFDREWVGVEGSR